MGREGLGAKRSPREAAPRLTPLGSPVSRVPTKDGGIGTSIGQKAGDEDQALRTDRKLGPTPQPPSGTTQTLRPRSPAPTPYPPPEEARKRADEPAWHNQNMPHKGGHMTNMPYHPRTHGAEPTECPVPDARHRTAATTSPASQRTAQKGHSTPSKEVALPPETQNHQHPCQPSKNDVAKPRFPRATAPPHIILYIGEGTVKTTNPKHTPPNRNHPAEPSHGSPSQSHSTTTHPSIHRWGHGENNNPNYTPPNMNHLADKQTSPQYMPEKPNATAEHSDAHPATPSLGCQSRRGQNHRSNTTARHTADDRMQQRAPKVKAVHKAHTMQMHPHQPS
ncbi:hypothetical protein CRENBAI_012446 [Crenichthys baileyi]|uniref:Uncharacterized protein n=1 Tax=Crenichthys baileyi TaxID=28760 RepID=A0AAV9R4M8_9TELE